MSELEKTFLKFVACEDTTIQKNTISSKTFCRMLKECGVVDENAVTSSDGFIAFNAVKYKGAHHINYVEFLQAIKLLSRKCFKDQPPEEALQATVKLIEGKQPEPAKLSMRSFAK